MVQQQQHQRTDGIHRHSMESVCLCAMRLALHYLALAVVNKLEIAGHQGSHQLSS